MRPSALIAALFFAAACGGETPPASTQNESNALALPSTNVVDLTHVFNAETVYWPTADGFRREVTDEGITEGGYFYASGTFSSSEHGGTHLDAPIHFAEKGQASEEIPLERLMGPAVVVDVSDHAEANADYQISVEDLETWETEHGPIPDGSIVLFRTGFGAFWPDRARYMGTAARWLIENRSVDAVGIDTPSIDFGQSQLFESHQALFQENIPAFENVANLDQVPIEGSIVIALPMKIEGGSGGPLRIIAFTP